MTILGILLANVVIYMTVLMLIVLWPNGED